MNFYKINDNLLKTLSLRADTNAYALEKDKIIIGYGIITNDINSKIEIFIKEEHRSNGYGKLLFGKMIEELKKGNYKEIKLTFKRDNYRIKNIIVTYGGYQLYTDETEDSYILFLK